MHFHDARDAVSARYEHPEAPDRRVRVRCVHEHRTAPKDARRRAIVHSKSLGQGCRRCDGCIRLHRFPDLYMLAA